MISRCWWLAAVVVGWAYTGGGCGEEQLDDVRWACARDRDCGHGAHCRLGLCASGEATPVAGLECSVAATASSGSAARFSLEATGEQRVLVFSAGGREAWFALPADVIALDQAPLETCCANPCCPLLPP